MNTSGWSLTAVETGDGGDDGDNSGMAEVNRLSYLLTILRCSQGNKGHH